jgi:SAM-dependent methyltransferase
MSNIQHEQFFQEYTSQEAILKYTRATAGSGIAYLLDHDYKQVYLDALKQMASPLRQERMQVLEFGCGAGMNLIHLLSVFREEGIEVETAIGTDFSPVLIEAAKREAKNYLAELEMQKIQFHVASNESLLSSLSDSLGMEQTNLASSFHFIFGVNTVRYCHAVKQEIKCAESIFDLLKPGGICVSIDMNNRFPLFRSDLRSRLRGHNEEECYVPSLEEYVAPFAQAGFEVLRSEHFCWVPHSAGELLRRLTVALSPLLNAVVPSRAMRSLVVVRKPR